MTAGDSLRLSLSDSEWASLPVSHSVTSSRSLRLLARRQASESSPSQAPAAASAGDSDDRDSPSHKLRFELGKLEACQ